MARNEKTSKRIASEAGDIVKNADQYIRWVGRDLTPLMKKRFILFIRRCRRVAASALTQAPNRRK